MNIEDINKEYGLIKKSTMVDMLEAIHLKTDSEEYLGGIAGSNFPAAIESINKLQKMNSYSPDDDVEDMSNYYGYRAAAAAASYYFAVKSGTDKFEYSSQNMFSENDDGSAMRMVRSTDGYALLDCSAFIGLCLRNIPYENSCFVHTDSYEWPIISCGQYHGSDGIENLNKTLWEYLKTNDLAITESNIQNFINNKLKSREELSDLIEPIQEAFDFNKNSSNLIGGIPAPKATFLNADLSSSFSLSSFHPLSAVRQSRTGTSDNWSLNYGNDGWEFKALDYQPEGAYSNIGYSGRSSLRFAADYAEYFYRNGYIIFDASSGYIGSDDEAKAVIEELRPGDLIFWAKGSASETQKRRFKGISHIAMVSENTEYYYHCTGAKDYRYNGGNGHSVIYRSNLINNSEDKHYYEIELIIRPDYRKRVSETPSDVNLLVYPYRGIGTASGIDDFVEWTDGIEIKYSGTNSIIINGKSSSGNDYTKSLKGKFTASSSDLSNAKDYHLALSLGTYQLSITKKTKTSPDITLLIYKNLEDETSSGIYDYKTSSSGTFDITEEGNYCVALRTSDENYSNAEYSLELIRLGQS
jgi:hypothetical protein